MMNVTYGVAKEIYSLGNSSRTSYGIAAYADTEKDGTATIVDRCGGGLPCELNRLKKTSKR